MPFNFLEFQKKHIYLLIGRKEKSVNMYKISVRAIK